MQKTWRPESINLDSKRLIGMICLSVVWIALGSVVASAQTYGFDAGAEGWSEGDPFGTGFGGTLFYVPAGGNPGGFMQADDVVAGGGAVVMEAPAPILGDLSLFEGVEWDQLLPAAAVLNTSVIVRAADGTIYRTVAGAVGPTGVWTPRSANFQSSVGWVLLTGGSTFEDTISNTNALYIEFDVITNAGIEAGIDNVSFVLATPTVPSMSWLGAVVAALSLMFVGSPLRSQQART